MLALGLYLIRPIQQGGIFHHGHARSNATPMYQVAETVRNLVLQTTTLAERMTQSKLLPWRAWILIFPVV